MTTGVELDPASPLVLPPSTTDGTVFGDMDMLMLGTRAAGEYLVVERLVLLVAVVVGGTEVGGDRLLPIGMTVEAADDCDVGCLKGASNASGLDIVVDDDDDDGTGGVEEEATMTGGYFSCK